MARPIRVAAAGDVHCDEVNRDEIERALARVEGEVDAILLAGDLTTYGELEQGELLAELCAPLETPIYAVLGNHDWHCNQAAELTTVLEAAGVRMIDRGHAIQELDGARLGIAGAKGFVGGFPDSALPDFGEPLLRQVYAETTAEVVALDAGPRGDRGLRLPDRPAALRADARARSKASRAGSTPSSAPTGWPRRSLEHHPDLALHGHAHVGAFQGAVGDVPVYNVAVPSLARDFFVFELDGGSVRVA